MQIVGINDATKLEILKLVSAILHIGNITFIEEGNYAAVNGEDCKFCVNITKDEVAFFQSCDIQHIYSDYNQMI